MANWSRFFPDVLLHVHGASEPAVERALLRAAADFFKRSRAWREWLAPVVTTAGAREYTLPVPDGAIVIQLDQGRKNDDEWPILSYRCFRTDIDVAPSIDGDQGVTTRDRVLFTLAQDVPVGTVIKLQATLAPGEGATGISDAMFSQHVDDIAKGAISRLMLTANQPYSNPDMGLLLKGEFNAAIDTLNIDAYRGHTSNTPRNRAKWV